MRPKVALGVFACLLGGYFVLRFQGLWSENDTATFGTLITAMRQAGTVDAPGAYPHGYAYQAVITALLSLTGLTLQTFLQVYSPVLGTLLLVLFAFIGYRALFRQQSLALLSTAMLFLVPEMYFTAVRGNHEKFTVSLTFLAAFILVRLLAVRRMNGPRSQVALWGTALALCFLTLGTLNIFFGSLFLMALTLSLPMLLLGHFWLRFNRRDFQTLLAAVGGGWVIVTLIFWVIYPPVRADLSLLTEASQHLLNLFHTSKTSSNPYAVVTSNWVNPWVYQLLTVFRWVLLGGSLLSFMAELWTLQRTKKPPSTERALLLTLYVAALLQFAAAIPVDFLGLAAGTNLEVRMYTYTVLWAMPMLALGLWRLRPQPGVSKRIKVQRLGFLLAFGAFLGASIFKATLDPVISNAWLGYAPAEIQAVQSWNTHTQGAGLWVGPEGRVSFGYLLDQGSPDSLTAQSNRLLAASIGGTQAGYALRGSVADAYNRVWGLPLPQVLLGSRIYDNGKAQIVWRKPLNQFQR